MKRLLSGRRVVAIVCFIATGLLFFASFASPKVPPSPQVKPLPSSAPVPATKGAQVGKPKDYSKQAGLHEKDDDWDANAKWTGTTHWRNPIGQTVGWLGGKLSGSLGGGTPKVVEKTYRQRLESTTSPPYFDATSPTLSFSHIYVLSLPSRQDRRDRMEKLGRALGLRFTFVDAISKDQGVVRWIAERVEETRKKKRPLVAKLLDKDPSKVGGLKPGCDWLIRGDGERGNSSFAPAPEQSPVLPPYEFPSLSEAKWDNKDWVAYLNSHGPEGLDAKEGSKFNVAERLHDPNERILQRQLSAGSVAVWYGQTGVMRKMVENGDESALVLEDDVDIEWDIARLWANVHRRLPKGKDGWQMAFLGHCWGRESTRAHPSWLSYFPS